MVASVSRPSKVERLIKVGGGGGELSWESEKKPVWRDSPTHIIFVGFAVRSLDQTTTNIILARALGLGRNIRQTLK